MRDQPAKVKALLRSHVGAIRLLQRDREAAVQVIMRRLRYDRPYAERAHAEAMAGFDERGRLPMHVMPIFWEAAMAAGEVREPWPESRYLDRRFIDTFAEWTPK